jgi:hypothetical protein
VDRTQTNSNGVGITPAGDLTTEKNSTSTTTVH